jgi:uncharacterized membrane protein
LAPVSVQSPAEKHGRRHSVFDPRRGTGRLIIATALALVVLLVGPREVDWPLRAVLAWDVGAFSMSSMAWWFIWRADAEVTAHRAAREDPGRNMVWLIALASSLFSLFVAAYVLRQVRQWPSPAGPVWTAIAVFAVLLSWILTHTAYTLRYAHLYYHGKHVGGLEFPGKDAPAEIDFAYFAFTIGMCFQVSDVVISSSRIRRAALVHAVLTFAYNTTILALVLNFVFSFVGGN